MKQKVLGLIPEFTGKYYIHSTACVIGNVKCKGFFSAWPNAVLRADINRIIIGEYVNIQDNAVVHVSHKFGTIIADNVTIGHNAIVHACEIGENTLIGMGAIVLDGAVIGKNCIIGAGSLVGPGKHIPDNSLALGTPCRVLRAATDEDIAENLAIAKRYWELAIQYIKNGDIIG